MARFTLLENAVWEDQAFRVLGVDARLMFLWAWSNPSAAICGLYHTSEKRLLRALELGAEPNRIGRALEELSYKPLVRYDAANEVIWVVNRARHANRSPRVASRMQKEVQECPDSPLVEEFVAIYGEMLRLRLEE
jgi:hypothetical protein